MYHNRWSHHSGFFIFWFAAGVEETLMMRRGFVGELDRQAPSQRSIPVSLQRSVHMYTYFMFARTKRRRASDRNVGISPFFFCGFRLHGAPTSGFPAHWSVGQRWALAPVRCGAGPLSPPDRAAAGARSPVRPHHPTGARAEGSGLHQCFLCVFLLCPLYWG